MRLLAIPLFAFVAVAAMPGAAPDAQAQIVLAAAGAGERDQASAALGHLNAVRAAAGVSPLHIDARLVAAASGHAGYLVRAGRVAHDQRDRASHAFTGATPGERIAKAGGGFTAHAELASRATGGAARSAAELFVSGVYHRLLLLRDDLDLVGLALRGGGMQRTLVANLGAVGERPIIREPILWPPRDAMVAGAFDTDAETPDPLPGRNKAGYPISVQVDARRTLAVERFELVHEASGASVAANLHTASSDRHTPAWAAFLLPLEPLAPAARYRVRFAGASDGERIERTWTFRTAPIALAATAGEERVQFTVSGLDATETYVVCNGDRATLDGLRFLAQNAFSFERRGACAAGACEVNVGIAYDLSCREQIASARLRLAAPR